MADLVSLGLPGNEQSWAALGFRVDRERLQIGSVSCVLNMPPSWGFDEVRADASVLGIPELVSENISAAPDPTHRAEQVLEHLADDPDSARATDVDKPRAPAHPNGVSAIDHLVYLVADLDEAVAGMTDVLGMPPRRRFHPRGPAGPEMAFYRVGEPFIEVVAGGQPALIGIAFATPDLDTTVAAARAAGAPIGDPKPAVQGGRIASVWSGHVEWGVAFMGAVGSRG